MSRVHLQGVAGPDSHGFFFRLHLGRHFVLKVVEPLSLVDSMVEHRSSTNRKPALRKGTRLYPQGGGNCHEAPVKGEEEAEEDQ